MGKSLLIKSVVIGFVAGLAICVAVTPQTINADLKNNTAAFDPSTLVKNGHLTVCKFDASGYQVVKTMNMVLTAYASVPEETDSTPFITASGKQVADGIIATNILPFGTKIKIPGIFGEDKVFVVEDRMNAKYNGALHADIWMPSVKAAKTFGAKTAKIEIVES